MDERDLALQQALATLRYIGYALRNRRLKLKKSVAEISFVTGISRDDVTKIEEGGDTGSAADPMAIAEVLGLDYFEILKEALDFGKRTVTGE